MLQTNIVTALLQHESVMPKSKGSPQIVSQNAAVLATRECYTPISCALNICHSSCLQKRNSSVVTC